MTTEETKGWNDRETYRAMQVPFENTEEAKEAYSKFVDDLAELRKKHRIADVHVICRLNAVTEGGDDGSMLVSVHLGSSLEAVGMCAYAYGRQKQIFDESLVKALRGRDR